MGESSKDCEEPVFAIKKYLRQKKNYYKKINRF